MHTARRLGQPQVLDAHNLQHGRGSSYNQEEVNHNQGTGPIPPGERRQRTGETTEGAEGDIREVLGSRRFSLHPVYRGTSIWLTNCM